MLRITKVKTNKRKHFTRGHPEIPGLTTDAETSKEVFMRA